MNTCTSKLMQSDKYAIFVLNVQSIAPIPVKMEEHVHLLILVPVMWGGQDYSVKQVSKVSVEYIIGLVLVAHCQ